MKKVKYPLMKENIDDVICFDIHMVVEGSAPEYTEPDKPAFSESWRMRDYAKGD